MKFYTVFEITIYDFGAILIECFSLEISLYDILFSVYEIDIKFGAYRHNPPTDQSVVVLLLVDQPFLLPYKPSPPPYYPSLLLLPVCRAPIGHSCISFSSLPLYFPSPPPWVQGFQLVPIAPSFSQWLSSLWLYSIRYIQLVPFVCDIVLYVPKLLDVLTSVIHHNCVPWKNNKQQSRSI